VRNHELVGVPPLRTYDDISALGAEVKRRGFKALKTNILPFDGEKLTNFGPGFGRSPGYPELNCDRKTLQAVRDLLGAFRAGAGPEMGLHLDVNYHFKTEGYLQIAKAVAPFDMTWLEIDTWDPQSLALIRRAAPCPIASLESVCGRRAFRPFFDAYATDVAIIDVIWNGFLESIKVAAMAEAYEVNCAPHNYYGHLCSAISAHFCAVVPNFRVMEIDIDSVSWRDELFLNAPAIENGELIVPTGPGWGVEVNEAAVRAHPPGQARGQAPRVH
jgi:galactonate dehydratase